MEFESDTQSLSTLNQELTNKYAQDPKFVRFKAWLQENGVLMDNRVQFPTYFGSQNIGVTGVSAAKTIERGRVIVAIPYRLLITVEKVKKIPLLDKIIKENPDMFRSNNQSPFSILVLYVCHELLKGDKSFYHPYFQVCETNFADWKKNELKAIGNQEIVSLIKDTKEDTELVFMCFLRIFRRYEEVFPQQLKNQQYQKLFVKAHNFVSTRAFGWSLPSVSLIPLADSFNHGTQHLTHYLVNLQEEMSPSDKYEPKHKKINLSIFKKKELNPTQQQLAELRKNKLSRRAKFIAKHRQILKEFADEPHFNQKQRENRQFQHILYQQYKAEVRKFRQMRLYESSCSEDNDTDEEDIYDYNYRSEQFNFYDRYERTPEKNVKNKKQEIERYWKLVAQEEKDESSEEETVEKQKANKPQQKKQPSSNKQILKTFQQDSKDSQKSSEVSSSESSDQDDQHPWIESYRSANSEYADTYFTLQTCRKTPQREQLYVFYGRRSNAFLLENYEFVLEDNKYDSFLFKLKLGQPSLAPAKLIYRSISVQNCQLFSKAIKIKKQRVNIELITICRAYIWSWAKQDYPNARITVAFDRVVEESTLELAKSILKVFLTQLREVEDIELTSVAGHTAQTFRENQKEIVEEQMKLLSKCAEFMKRWKKGRVVFEEKEMEVVVKVWEYLLCLERGCIE